MATTTPQQALEAKLKEIGLPYHEIKVYGRQITVECISRDTCAKWAAILAKFARVRGMIKSVVEKKEFKGKTQGHYMDEAGIMRSTKMGVWRVYAAIE